MVADQDVAEVARLRENKGEIDNLLPLADLTDCEVYTRKHVTARLLHPPKSCDFGYELFCNVGID
jgi:hypothetical protein